MNSLEELSAKLAKKVSPDGWLCGPDSVEEYTRLLVAALGAQPAVSREYQGRDGKWYPFIGEQHYKNTVADGTWPIRELFAAPVLPSVPEGWIDVKDRLPDTAGVFLVICDRGVQSYHPIIGVFNRDFDSPYPWSVPGTATVTHWMPLPAAPSPQEDNP